MIQAIIIDDELHAIQALAGLLALYCPQVSIAGHAQGVAEGMELIREKNPELVFLDVHIGEETGFELLEQLQERAFQLIFTTGHSDYAIKAFRYNAIDYLLKPVDPDQLQEAVGKVTDRSNPGIDSRQLQQFLESLTTQQLEKLTIATAEGYHFFEVSQIIRIAGEGNYSTLYLQNGEQVVASKQLKSFEELLPSDQFIKVHQSHIVNLRRVKQLLFQDGSYLLLEDDSQVPLARRRKDQVMAALKIK
jgi:two-component system LytT family response regulator